MPDVYRSEKCSICHDERTGQIDMALIGSGESVPKLAKRWKVGERSLYRHKATCLPRRIRDAAALTEVEALAPEQLIARVIAVEQRAKDLVDASEMSGDLRERAAALRELRSTVELLAKMSYSAAENPRQVESGRPDLDAELEAAVRTAALKTCPSCGANLAERVRSTPSNGGEAALPVLELEAGDVEEAELCDG